MYLEDEMNGKKAKTRIQIGIILISPILILLYTRNNWHAFVTKNQTKPDITNKRTSRLRASKFKTLQNYIGLVRSIKSITIL